MDGTAAWRQRLRRILDLGRIVAPRGQRTLELLNPPPLTVDLARPVVMQRERRMNYRFMAAEALWILDGDQRLAPLTRFVKRMAEFSDDGETLSGAYGPMIVPQLPYVVKTLVHDRWTRQAVLTIWRPSPEPSKDIPCTVAMTFSIREGDDGAPQLHQSVFMRSSDAWLGVPYDVFSFAMVGVRVACEYNRRSGAAAAGLGTLAVHVVSSHLYEAQWAAADEISEAPWPAPVDPIPAELVTSGNWRAIEDDLVRQREGQATWCWSPRPVAR
jgi:thymidylate synthase